MTRTALFLATLLSVTTAQVQAAEPIRIGITTILSGPTADRGQSEQYGAQLALNHINESGGVLGRPVEAFYADNACKPAIGVPATQRLIEREHVPVIIGALCTPVTHAIMPVIEQAHVPLIIATSAGQDFVDASGVGGNVYAFKTIPSEVDIAGGLVRYLVAHNVKSVAVVSAAGGFPQLSADAIAKAAKEAGLQVTDQERLAPGTTDFGPVIDKLKAGNPDQLVTVLGPFTAGFFRAYETSGWKVPVTGRVDFQTALAAVSPQFRAAGGLATLTGVAVFTPDQDLPGVKAFVASYKAHYGLVPTQRAFFVYEATLLAVDAIRRAKSDQPEAIEAALRTTEMPSALGGTYAPDAHNHAHTPLQIVGIRNDRVAVIANE
ncbi:ABC transporter substrate-binding protein [Burkholderia sp. L27(2015)]|uniref:ABC transporter substrate-binding protein n=1 Tax=Burkholderia sp. L27(2015) TaxID=1641858 RepID=UPI00131B1589|nr:ABC transporter substrate-binding protein [Burkholderia sp. L27(2015)]